MKDWKFITNHAAVLLMICRGRTKVRQISDELDLTERSVMRIISELEESGYLFHHHAGRVNRYQIKYDATLRTGPVKDVTVGDLLAVLNNGAILPDGRPAERPAPVEGTEATTGRSPTA